jgi:hypothetical protein
MPPRRTALATVVAAAGLAAAGAPPATAGCGGTQVQKPLKRLGDFRAPLIVGDSVLLGAIPQVARQGYAVNTRGCRSWSEGAKIVRRRAARGTLPHMVAMFLGADWEVSIAQIRETLFRLGPERVLVLVTPREVGGRGGKDAHHMRVMARENPHRILLLDWARHTRDRPRWFAPDGLHLSYPGISGLARFLRRALKYAAPGAFPGPELPPAEPEPAPEPAPAPQPDPGSPPPPAA